MTLRRVFLSELMFWVLFAALGIYGLLPLRQSIRFGSDLVGGTYLTLEVHTQEAVDAELVSKMQAIEAGLKRAGKQVPATKNVQNGVMSLTFSSLQDAQEASVVIKGQETDLEQSVNGATIQLSFPERKEAQIKKEAVQRNIEILRTRLDKFSVAEILITEQGKNNIVIELPDVADPQAAKAMIGRAAKLEFRLVDKYAPSKEDILYEYDGELPGDKEIMPGKGTHGGFYLVSKYAEVTGGMLKDAKPGFGGETQSEPVVNFAFNEEGSAKFYDLTNRNIGRPLAIVLDGVVISAPRINTAIEGSGQISGRFTTAETRELATLLKSGSFVAQVSFAEERQIGPALGDQARRDGLMSCLVGLGLLFVFSLWYYNLSGLFAFIALIYNLLLILMALSWLKATLTLPGIGGLVLTVGMAIDASILIFEHIKEELSKSVPIRKAVHAGFSDALVVILDANITTFVVGAVLYYFGTGPIKGFAVTMMFGIVATLISGLFFLRAIFKFVLNNFSIQKLRI